MEKIKIIEPKTIIINRVTGELVDEIPPGSKPGLYRIQQDFTNVPSQADQSQRDENNISLLVKKYKPDELAMYLAAKNQQRPEINDHDFSQEPDLQGAMNIALRIRQEFESLPEMIQNLFKGKPSEFLKFAENPKNLPQLVEWGLAEKVEAIQNDIKKPASEPSEPIPTT